jgi:hypothetical protein
VEEERTRDVRRREAVHERERADGEVLWQPVHDVVALVADRGRQTRGKVAALADPDDLDAAAFCRALADGGIDSRAVQKEELEATAGAGEEDPSTSE